MASVFRKPQESERNFKASLYFGNLDPQVAEPLLYELFIQFGPIKTLNLPKDRILKTHQGFGFVEFRSVQDADYTLQILTGVLLYGKTLKLKKAEPLKNSSQAGAINEPVNDNVMDVGAKLFINNLSPLVDEKYLQDTFSKFGTLIRPPIIMRDADTGESKGYGFISFSEFAQSDAVIEKMDEQMLMNKKVLISYAYKEDASGKKREKHGDKVERMLAESAKSHNVGGKKAYKVKKKEGRNKKSEGRREK